MAEETEKSKGPSRKDANALAAQFQIMQQQLQSVLVQKENIKANVMEMERALEELGKTDKETAYKIAGPVMVNKKVEDIKKELEEGKESLEVRMKSLEKTEKNLTKKLKDLQTQLKEMFK